MRTEKYNFRHDTIGHSVEPINKLIEKYDTLKSDHHTFNKVDEKIWKKQDTDSFYLPYYHRGEIGFQYIPTPQNSILGIYMYNDTELRSLAGWPAGPAGWLAGLAGWLAGLAGLPWIAGLPDCQIAGLPGLLARQIIKCGRGGPKSLG